MKPTDGDRFVKLVRREQGSVLRELHRDRKIKPSDVAVFHFLADYADTKTGRIYVTADALADDIGFLPSNVRAAFSRLKAQHLLRLIRDPRTGERFYLLNPWIVRAGTPANEGLAMKQFQEA